MKYFLKLLLTFFCVGFIPSLLFFFWTKDSPSSGIFGLFLLPFGLPWNLIGILGDQNTTPRLILDSLIMFESIALNVTLSVYYITRKDKNFFGIFVKSNSSVPTPPIQTNNEKNEKI